MKCTQSYINIYIYIYIYACNYSRWPFVTLCPKVGGVFSLPVSANLFGRLSARLSVCAYDEAGPRDNPSSSFQTLIKLKWNIFFCKYLGHVRSCALQLIEYLHNWPKVILILFCIPEVIFEVRALKFFGPFTRLMNRCDGFYRMFSIWILTIKNAVKNMRSSNERGLSAHSLTICSHLFETGGGYSKYGGRDSLH